MNSSAATPLADEEAVRACIQAIGRASSIVITAHAKPDGDAVGSCLALKRLLQASGKRARVAGLAPLPSRFRSLVMDGELVLPSDVLTPDDGMDLLVALDAASVERIPEEFRGLRGKRRIVNIDHHPDNTLFGDVNLVDAAACSTGEIVCRLAATAGFPLNRDIATLLWIAIVTDTGRFTHENTTPRAMRAAAELLAYGVPTEDVDRRIYRSLTPAETELQKRVMQSLELHADGRVAFATLGRDDFAAAGCGPEETNELVEIPRSIAGVEIAALFYDHEKLPPGIKVSMRSNAPYDVAAVCREHGGGGHPRAAGCTLLTDMAGAKRTILESLGRKGLAASRGGKPER